MNRVLVFRLLPVVASLSLAGLTLAAAHTPGPAAAGAERLPDLEQAAPSGLTITRAGPRDRPLYRLGFDSAVNNVGEGPLVIDAGRASAATETMSANQLVEREGAPSQTIAGAGALRYVVSPDHRHWHLLGFDRYQLRRAGQGSAGVRDRKSGFCLGDRYRLTGRRLPDAPREGVYTSRCGLGDGGLLGLQEGISVGYGDDYAANLEGQYLSLTGLRAGRYVLVHRVNGARRLRELDYSNNAASMLIELRWRRGRPEVRVVKTCPDNARCARS